MVKGQVLEIEQIIVFELRKELGLIQEQPVNVN